MVIFRDNVLAKLIKCYAIPTTLMINFIFLLYVVKAWNRGHVNSKYVSMGILAVAQTHVYQISIIKQTIFWQTTCGINT